MDETLIKYQKKISNLENDLGEDITNYFINTVISIRYLQKTYGFVAEEFDYEGDLFLDMPPTLQNKLIDNIKTIAQVISDTLPVNIYSIAKMRHYIINRFATNYWVQSFLLDKHWQEISEKDKINTLKDIFENIFSELLGKDIANIVDDDIEYPLGAPWTDISYPIIPFDSNYQEYENKVMKQFAKELLYPEKKLDIKPSPNIVQSRTDQLNILLKLSNKNENYKNRLIFIDAYRLDSYTKLKYAFNKYKKQSDIYEDILAHFYWFEFRRRLFWNSTFFMKTKDFLELYQYIIKEKGSPFKFESIRNNIINLTQHQLEIRTKQFLDAIEKKSHSASLSFKSAPISRKYENEEYTEQGEVLLGADITFGKIDVEEYNVKGALTFYNPDKNKNLLNIYYDINQVIPKWSNSLKELENIKIIFDHSDFIGKKERTINEEFIEVANKSNLFRSFNTSLNYLSNKNKQAIKPFNETPPHTSKSAKYKLIIKHLYDINIFDYNLTKIILEYYKVKLTAEEFYKIISDSQLINPITKEWFGFQVNSNKLIKTTSYIKLKDHPKKFVELVNNYLKEILENGGQEKSSLYDKKIKPNIFYNYLKCELILNKTKITQLFIKSFFQYIINKWSPELIQELIRFYQENQKYIFLENYKLDFENDLLRYFDAWFSIVKVYESDSEKIKLKRKYVWTVERITPKFAALDFVGKSEKASVFSAISGVNLKIGWKNKSLKSLKESGKWLGGEKYYKREVELYLKLNLLGKAEESALKLVDIDSENYVSYELLVKVYGQAKKYEEAIRVLEEIIKKFPDKEEEALSNIVSAYILLKDFDKAEKLAKTIYDKFPKNILAFASLATVYRESKQYLKEIKIHNEIIKKFPDKQEIALTKIVETYILLKDFKKAEEQAKILKEKFPNSPNSLGTLSSVYRNFKQYNKEIKIHLEALDKYPNLEKQILPLLSGAYLNNDENDKAEESALKLVDLDSENYESYELLVKVYGQAKKYEEAIKILNEIIKKFPDKEEQALLSIVNIYNKQGNKVKALQNIDKLLSKYPTKKYKKLKKSIVDQ